MRPGVHAQTLPDAVAEDETGVEHRNDGLGARLQLAVDVDLDVAIARIVDEFVGALGHGGWPVCPENADGSDSRARRRVAIEP